MKIAFVFGKGIDGCGVTRGAMIYEEWLCKNGHSTLVVDFDNDQLFIRAQDAKWIGKVYNVSKNEKEVSKKIIDVVNSCDIAIFHSHPTRKQFDYVDRYRNFLSKIDQPIIVMHDHSIAKSNVNAIPQACELFAMSDTAVIQSLDGYSKKAYTDFDKGIKNYLIENPIWIYPKKYDKYRKLFEERRKHFLYIGRMSPLKDPALICRIQPMMNKWDLSIIGCENSISSVSMYTDDISVNPSPYIPEFKKIIHQYRLDKNKNYVYMTKNEEVKDAKIKSYDRYIYDWGMNQLGSSFASWCGYNLADVEEYGYRMEYTMIESYLLTLPVINKHFAENAKSPEGKLWGDYGCALVSCAREEQALADELNRLQHNKSEWNERTKACQELITKFNDIYIVGQQYLDKILKNGKRQNKVNGIDIISQYFPSASKRRANGEIIMSSANGSLNKIPMIMEDGKQVIMKEEPTSSLEDFFA